MKSSRILLPLSLLLALFPACDGTDATTAAHLEQVLAELPTLATPVDIMKTPNTLHARYSVRDSVEDSLNFHEEKLAAAGWTEVVTRKYAARAILEYSKLPIVAWIFIKDDLRGSTEVILKLRDESLDHCREDGLGAEDAAVELLNHMESTYRALSTYRDSGTQNLRTDSGFTRQLSFITHFARPDKFRFEFESADKFQSEFESEGCRYVVHQSGETVQTYWDVRGFETEDSLEMALAGATGVSGGVASRVPGLLGLCAGLVNLRDPRLCGEKEIDGILCVGIEGFNYLCDPVSLWIGKEDLLLRLVEEHTTLAGSTVSTVTDYKPEANPELTEVELAFEKAGLLSVP